jgi:hypothetical protein
MRMGSLVFGKIDMIILCLQRGLLGLGKRASVNADTVASSTRQRNATALRLVGPAGWQKHTRTRGVSCAVCAPFAGSDHVRSLFTGVPAPSHELAPRTCIPRLILIGISYGRCPHVPGILRVSGPRQARKIGLPSQLARLCQKRREAPPTRRVLQDDQQSRL